LAFANLYSEFAQAIIAEKLSQPFAPFLESLPSSDDGVHVMEMIQAANNSNDQDGAWMELGKWELTTQIYFDPNLALKMKI
jgi:hypothetical protein